MNMEKRYVAELEKELVKRTEELQAERMVTFKLSQQIESLEKENKDLSDKVANWRDSWTHMNAAIERKDAALKECLLAKARECYAAELNEARAALFNMQALANSDCPKCARKDAALKECLKMIDCDDQSDLYWKPVVKQIKEALK